jgi:hypothetical protein
MLAFHPSIIFGNPHNISVIQKKIEKSKAEG